MSFEDMYRKVPAIPTVYRDVQYRSRLEARWAAFFDMLGWKYQYEPFDLNGWIPDFILLGRQSVLVEIKPTTEFPQDVADKIDAAGFEYEALIVGCVITPQSMWDPEPGGFQFGWLREVDTYGEDEGPSSHWSDAAFGRWREGKGQIGFRHDVGSFQDRITGGYDGGSCGGVLDLLSDEINMFWNRAGNLVRWRGKQSETR